jgi:hypothetical protein
MKPTYDVCDCFTLVLWMPFHMLGERGFAHTQRYQGAAYRRAQLQRGMGIVDAAMHILTQLVTRQRQRNFAVALIEASEPEARTMILAAIARRARAAFEGGRV